MKLIHSSKHGECVVEVGEDQADVLVRKDSDFRYADPSDNFDIPERFDDLKDYDGKPIDLDEILIEGYE